jgi:hypothetical protein
MNQFGNVSGSGGLQVYGEAGVGVRRCHHTAKAQQPTRVDVSASNSDVPFKSTTAAIMFVIMGG